MNNRPPGPGIYLDNAATSFPKPPTVARAMVDHLEGLAVSPGRSGHDRALAAGRQVDHLRGRLAELFRNPGRDLNRTVFTANATDALNHVLRGVCRPGDHVVSTVMEHNSVLRPIHMLSEAGFLTYSLAPADANGLVDPAEIAARLRPETRLVIMTHASNVCGTIQPVAEVGALCRRSDVLFCLDAAQSAGILDIDMERWGVDLLAFTGHKGLLGPTGTGGLLVAPDVQVSSSRWGGTGVLSDLRTHPETWPYRLEAGTLNAVGLAGLAAAMDWVEKRGTAELHRKEMALADRFVDGCASLPGIRIHGRAGSEHLAILAVTCQGRDPEAVGLFLDHDWDLAVRTGLQCAPLAHQAIGTLPDGTVRISFGPFNVAEDVDRLLAALDKLSS